MTNRKSHKIQFIVNVYDENTTFMLGMDFLINHKKMSCLYTLKPPAN